MNTYVVSHRRSLKRVLSIQAESMDEVKALLNLVGNAELCITADYGSSITRSTRKFVANIHLPTFELPRQMSEIIRELLSWSE